MTTLVKQHWPRFLGHVFEPVTVGSLTYFKAKDRHYLIYTAAMATVAERLRRESIQRSRKMSPAERLSEALALGRAGVQAHAHAHKLSVDEARYRLERAGQAGRRASKVMQGILE